MPQTAIINGLVVGGNSSVVARYLEGHLDSLQVTLARFLQTEAKPRPALVDQIWADLVGGGEVKVSTQVQTAVVILRLAMPDNEVANARSTTWTGWQTEVGVVPGDANDLLDGHWSSLP